ncbi:MAG: flavin reductase [Clostridia bacterium]|nr:flavin reductase [Clostridia bacterium]
MNPAVLSNLSYGMYAIGSSCDGNPNACIANSVVQVSSRSPEKVLVALTKDTHSCKAIKASGLFTISVLSTDTPASVIGALGLVSGEHTDKLRNIRHKVLTEGVPVIKENTCCWFLCKVIATMDLGHEVVFAAEITAGSDVSIGTPMTYAYYRSEMHGLSPKGSPTYIPPENTFDRSSGESFVCSVCGYVYKDPNFSFEELQDNWTCPVCKMPKKAFVRRT